MFRMITFRLRTLFLILILTIVATWAGNRLLQKQEPPVYFSTDSPSAAAADKLYVPANDDEANSISIYKQVSPAVVNITSTTIDFDFFFNAMPKQGAGSGSLIDAEGHILTNYHVIENARILEVTLADQRKFKAKAIGVDPSN